MYNISYSNKSNQFLLINYYWLYVLLDSIKFLELKEFTTD